MQLHEAFCMFSVRDAFHDKTQAAQLLFLKHVHCECRHTFATSQDSEIGLQQGRAHHLDQALSKTMTDSGSHMEASKRAGTAYLNLHKGHTFDLTHKTGSYMYMAPEVFKEQKYNEKVCRFLTECLACNVVCVCNKCQQAWLG